jgi:hypothetical protein
VLHRLPVLVALRVACGSEAAGSLVLEREQKKTTDDDDETTTTSPPKPNSKNQTNEQNPTKPTPTSNKPTTKPTNQHPTKAGAEMLCKAYLTSYRLPVIVTRGNNVYGPHQFPEKMIPMFTLLASRGKELPLHGDGMVRDEWREESVSLFVLVFWFAAWRGDGGRGAGTRRARAQKKEATDPARVPFFRAPDVMVRTRIIRSN